MIDNDSPIEKTNEAINICNKMINDQIESKNDIKPWQEVRDVLCLANEQLEINRQIVKTVRKIGLHKGQLCAFVSANEFLLRLGAEAYRRGEMDTAIQIRKQVTSYDNSIKHHQDNLENLNKELERQNRYIEGLTE